MIRSRGPVWQIENFRKKARSYRGRREDLCGQLGLFQVVRPLGKRMRADGGWEKEGKSSFLAEELSQFVPDKEQSKNAAGRQRGRGARAVSNSKRIHVRFTIPGKDWVRLSDS